MQIVFIRHAESNGNATNDYSTNAHDALSRRGLEQAGRLAGHLRDARFDAVYCSPLRRAVETILPYAGLTNRIVELWPELAEACWQEDRSPEPDGPVRFEPGHNLAGLDDRLYRFRSDASITPAGDETYGEGLRRLRTAEQLLLDRHQGSTDTLLVLSHEFAISRMIEMLLGVEPIGRFEHANTGVSLVVEEEGGFALRFTNRLQPSLAPGSRPQAAS